MFHNGSHPLSETAKWRTRSRLAIANLFPPPDCIVAGWPWDRARDVPKVAHVGNRDPGGSPNYWIRLGATLFQLFVKASSMYEKTLKQCRGDRTATYAGPELGLLSFLMIFAGVPMEVRHITLARRLEAAHMQNFLGCIRSGKEPNCPF